MIVKIYASFFNNIYKASHIYFFVKAQKLIFQMIIGDRYHDVISQYNSLCRIQELNILTEKVVELVNRMFTPAAFLNNSGDVPNINYS